MGADFSFSMRCPDRCEYQPHRIYLFGTKARGDAGPDSDFDILIVVSDSATAARYTQVPVLCAEWIRSV